MAVGNFAVGSDERKVRLDVAGAGVAVVKAMTRHPNVSKVAEYGAFSIRLLATGSDDRATKLVEAGAGEAVVASLTQCAADKDAANDGLSCIAQLANSTDRAARIAAAGGCDAVVRKLRRSSLQARRVKSVFQ